MTAHPGYDVTRNTHDRVVTEHHDGRIETDGPWLTLGDPGAPSLVVPAHVVVAVEACRPPCRATADHMGADGGR